MRPRITGYLEDLLQTDWVTYLVPSGTTAYILAMLVVMYVYVKRCEKVNLSAYHALGTCIYAIIGGLIGTRLFYLFEHFNAAVENPHVFLNPFGGTTSWGAYIGGLSGYFSYLKVKKLKSFNYADAFGSSLGLGPFIGRWCCFLHGCCYGTLSDLPWSIRYPKTSYLYWKQIEQGLINTNSDLSLAVHPLPVYLSLSALIVFILASKLWSRYRRKPGITFYAYWLLYAVLRFPLEYLRADVTRYGLLNLNLAQIICLIITATVIIIFLIYKFLKPLYNK